MGAALHSYFFAMVDGQWPCSGCIPLLRLCRHLPDPSSKECSANGGCQPIRGPSPRARWGGRSGMGCLCTPSTKGRRVECLSTSMALFLVHADTVAASRGSPITVPCGHPHHPLECSLGIPKEGRDLPNIRDPICLSRFQQRSLCGPPAETRSVALSISTGD
jgi:hypothetical protein